jgi:phage I-like protein
MKILSAFVAALDVGNQQGNERWIQLLPPGLHQVNAMTGPARILADRRGASLAQSALQAQGRPGLFDYEHRSLLSVDKADSRASGWLHEISWDDARGVLGRLELTPSALKAVREGEYRYVSPVVEHDDLTGQIFRIVGGTLTNDPAIKNQEALAALRNRTSSLVEGDPTAHTGKETNMEELLKQLAAALGLGETATKEQILAKLGEQVSAEQTAQAALKAAGAMIGELAALAGGKADGAIADQATAIRTALSAAKNSGGGETTLSALKADVAALTAANGALSKKLRDEEFERVMTPLRAAGKTAPAEENGLRLLFDADRGEFDASMAARPEHSMVPLRSGNSPAGPAGGTTEAAEKFSALVSAKEQELLSSGAPREAAYGRAWAACKANHPAEYKAAGGQ